MRKSPVLLSPTAPTLAEVQAWPATVGVPKAATALGISKSHLYALIKSGEAPVRILCFGSRQRVVTASLVTVLSEAA
jgi:hypothetical protein